MSEACPLCGRPFRGILGEGDTAAYTRTNARFDICHIGESDGEEYHTIHTDPDDEWLTPPEYVMNHTLESTGFDTKSVPSGDIDE